MRSMSNHCFIITIHFWLLSLVTAAALKQFEVAVGREIVLHPSNFTENLNSSLVCRIEVVLNEPATLVAGQVSPHIFDCNFTPGLVKYTHLGSHLLTEDVVKFNIYKFFDRQTANERVNFKFIIKTAPYDLVKIKGNLKVQEFYGTSKVIDNSILYFPYGRTKEALCRIHFSRMESHWPAYGRLIVGPLKQPIELMTRKCEDFLVTSFRYEHIRTPSSNIDYIHFLVEVSDPHSNNGRTVAERISLTVNIEPAFPNSSPKGSLTNMFLSDVDQFVPTTISSSILSASDKETPHDRLIYNISKPLNPGQGSIINLSSQQDPVYSFQQKDVDELQIAYKPPATVFNERQIFKLELAIFDDEFASSTPLTLNIAIKPVDSPVLRASIISSLTLLEGQSRPVMKNNLEIFGTSDSIKMFVVGGLKHGRIEVDEKWASSFTKEDLELGRVVYKHDDSDSTRDMINLRIENESHSVSVQLPVTIIPKDDGAPFLLVNLEIQALEGTSVHLMQDVLRATDLDSPPELITYIIKKPPEYGAIIKRLFWEKTGTEVTTFAQQDIDKGQIFYQHDGTKNFADEFEIVLEDSSTPPNVSPVFKVLVSIAPSLDKPPTKDPKSSFFLELKETEVKIITRQMLHFSDNESSPHDIMYTVTSEPRSLSQKGYKVSPGRIVSLKDDVPIPVTEFSQEEINYERIAYQPGHDDVGPHPQYFHFEFSVSDHYGNVVEENLFNITLLPVNNQVPQLYAGTILVEEGSNALITPTEFSIYDIDTEARDLQVSLFTVPLHGMLLRDNQPLRVGDFFSSLDVYSLRLEYSHDGTETFEDSFTIGVNDGINFVSGGINIKVKPVDDEPPAFRTNLIKELIVEEGSEILITSQALSATDVDTDDYLLHFISTELPRLGSLTVDNRPANRFTQRDVIEGKVKYRHNGLEIGPFQKRDSVTFIVTDRFSPYLMSHPTHALSIVIMPRNSNPPKISFRRALLVNEGGQVLITEDILSATDEDSVSQNLLFFVPQQPQFGFLENLRPILGSEARMYGRSCSNFTLADLRDNFISYVQAIHRGIEPESDQFEIFLSDGQFNSSTTLVMVNIIRQNDEPPELSVRNLTLQEGSIVRFNRSVFVLTDLDVPKDRLIIGIESEPSHGSLVQLVRQESTQELVEIPFTEMEQDSFYHHVAYKHDGTENFKDKFTLKVMDGVHTAVAVVYVHILRVNDEPPRLIFNLGISAMHSKDPVYITREKLLAEDVDTTSGEVIYQVVRTTALGKLQKCSILGMECSDVENDSFTQGDIDSNLVRYVFDSSADLEYEDEFSFVVTDGIHTTQEMLFKIRVADPVLAQLTLTCTGAVVYVGKYVALNSSMLSATDNSSREENIHFIIAQQPKFGHLELTTARSKPVDRFLMSDILRLRVLYNHTGDESGSDIFYFTVKNNWTQRNGSFYITVQPSPPSRHSLPVLRPPQPLTVIDNATEVITSQHLYAKDMYVPPENVTYVIHKKPEHGILLLSGKMLDTATFTQDDINQGRISYQKLTSKRHAVDSFHFQISNGRMQGYMLEDIRRVKPAKFEIYLYSDIGTEPKVTHMQSPKEILKFPDGQFGFQLNEHNLKSTDDTSTKEEILYLVIQSPRNGRIIRCSSGYQTHTFTQSEINALEICYIIDVVDTETVEDSLDFKVQNKEGKTSSIHRMHFRWRVVQLAETEVFVCENAGFVIVKMYRYGDLSDSSFVRVEVSSISAEEEKDFRLNKGLVSQFNPGDIVSGWTAQIISDYSTESMVEQFSVRAVETVNAILAKPDLAVVTVLDMQATSICANRSELENFSWESVFQTELSDVTCIQNISQIVVYNSSSTTFQQCDGKEWVQWLDKSDLEELDYILTNSSVITSDERSAHKRHCIKGWQLYRNECYRWFRKQSAWDEAKTRCEHLNSNLAVVDSVQQHQWLTEMTRSRPFWIGLKEMDLQHFQIPPGINFKWRRKLHSKNKCILVRGSGHWASRHCTLHHTYICQLKLVN